jgi:hypothetical protein
MKTDTIKSHLAFVRKDIAKIENMVVIQLEHNKCLTNQRQVLDALTKGITKWVENTQEGQELWKYTSEDLNIGDILSYHKNKTLIKYLKKEGIYKWKPKYELVEQEEVSYDRILVNQTN